jgi:hypothetical protein
MGLITDGDGWNIRDELWEKMEPLLSPPKAHPLAATIRECPIGRR